MRIEKVRTVILDEGKRLETAIYADESDTPEALAEKANLSEINEGNAMICNETPKQAINGRIKAFCADVKAPPSAYPLAQPDDIDGTEFASWQIFDALRAFAFSGCVIWGADPGGGRHLAEAECLFHKAVAYEWGKDYALSPFLLRLGRIDPEEARKAGVSFKLMPDDRLSAAVMFERLLYEAAQPDAAYQDGRLVHVYWRRKPDKGQGAAHIFIPPEAERLACADYFEFERPGVRKMMRSETVMKARSSESWRKFRESDSEK